MIIGIPYTINFTDPTVPGKTPFRIEPNSTDGPLTPILLSPDSSATEIHTSIVLPGMGLVQYGERVDESLVHILENFASCTPPVVPTVGQEWYDYCNKMMKVWDGDSWEPSGGGGLVVASTTEYNLLADDINKVIGPPLPGTIPGHETTVWGYGQQTLPILNTPPTEQQWTKLVQTVRYAGRHQGTDVTSLVDGGFTIASSASGIGFAGLYARFLDLQSKIVSVRNNRHNVNLSTLESSIIPGGSATRTQPWSLDLEHKVVVQFNSAAHMFAFFNSGGTLNVAASLDNTSTPANNRWYQLLQSVGAIKISAFYTASGVGTTHNGFYNIMPTVGQIFRHNVGGVNGNTLTVNGATDVANATVTISILFKDRHNGSLYSNYSLYDSEIVSGNLSSSITVTKASELYINDPEIPYPTMSTLVPLVEVPPSGPTTSVTFPSTNVLGSPANFSINNGTPNASFNLTLTSANNSASPIVKTGTLNSSGNYTGTVLFTNMGTWNRVTTSGSFTETGTTTVSDIDNGTDPGNGNNVNVTYQNGTYFRFNLSGLPMNTAVSTSYVATLLSNGNTISGTKDRTNNTNSTTMSVVIDLLQPGTHRVVFTMSYGAVYTIDVVATPNLEFLPQDTVPTLQVGTNYQYGTNAPKLLAYETRVIDHVNIVPSSLNGLPPGMSLSIPSGNNDNVYAIGTPTAPGTYQVSINVFYTASNVVTSQDTATTTITIIVA